MPPALTGSSGQRPSPDVASIEAAIATIDRKIDAHRQKHQSIYARSSHEVLEFSLTLLRLEQNQQHLSLQLSEAKRATQTQELNTLRADEQILHQLTDARESAPGDTVNLVHTLDPKDDPAHIVDVDHMSTPSKQILVASSSLKRKLPGLPLEPLSLGLAKKLKPLPGLDEDEKASYHDDDHETDDDLNHTAEPQQVRFAESAPNQKIKKLDRADQPDEAVDLRRTATPAEDESPDEEENQDADEGTNEDEDFEFAISIDPDDQSLIFNHEEYPRLESAWKADGAELRKKWRWQKKVFDEKMPDWPERLKKEGCLHCNVSCQGKCSLSKTNPGNWACKTCWNTNRLCVGWDYDKEEFWLRPQLDEVRQKSTAGLGPFALERFLSMKTEVTRRGLPDHWAS